MKCKACNGTGIDDDRLICYECDGTGEVELDKKWENTPWDTDIYLDDLDGKEPMTNEDWLRTCSTEELAEFIRKQRDDWSDGWYSDCHRFEEIIEWLKEKHE